jgi:hypothetical protein
MIELHYAILIIKPITFFHIRKANLPNFSDIKNPFNNLSRKSFFYARIYRKMSTLKALCENITFQFLFCLSNRVTCFVQFFSCLTIQSFKKIKNIFSAFWWLFALCRFKWVKICLLYNTWDRTGLAGGNPIKQF